MSTDDTAKKEVTLKESLVGCASVLILFGFCCGLPLSCSESEGDGADYAVLAARQFVENRLRSPSTAEFGPSPWPAPDDLGNGRYRVRGWVDAQNAFGGTVRSNFTVIVRSDGGDWVLEDIQMESR